MQGCSDEDLAVVRRLIARDLPWDMLRAVSFALFCTCAVPSIGELLGRTGKFEERTQKRYEDTGLLLEAVLEHGPDSDLGRAAVRRIDAMHRAYDISPDDLRYVLSTFVVMPVRWVRELGARPLTEHERDASTRYYRTAVLCPLDEHLLDALGYRHPSAAVRRGIRTGVRLRGRVARRLPPPRSPRWFRTQPVVRLHPDGDDVRALGTFPVGCPVPHGRSQVRP